MKKYPIIFILVLVYSNVFISAQTNVEWKKENFPNRETEFKDAYKMFAKGDKLYLQGPPYYEQALNLFLESYKFNPDNDYLNFHMGHIYFALHRPKDAEVYYEKAIQLNPKMRELILYELADAYHQDGEWDQAISHYKEYQSFLLEGGHKHLEMHEKDVPHELKWIQLCIQQCETGKVLTHDTLPIIFENISPAINTQYPEYSAVVNNLEDLLIFVSRRPSNTGDKKHHGQPFPYEDVYYTKRTNNGWTSAIHLHGDVNTHAHEAPVWVSGDGTRLLLYYNKSRTKSIRKQGDIYESDYIDGQWTKPKPMKMINTPWRETHASISPDGNTIYFTTNNPKYAKHGGLDIVKTTYDPTTKKWSKPEDIGNTINTEWDEESPFIKADNKHFYFSSHGHTSIGGFDFFKCERSDSGTFSTPVNLGFPLNTPYDEAFFQISDDGRRVFFNSNRMGGFGANDIYEGFILKDYEIPVEILVKDAETKQDIINPKLVVKESEGKPYFKEVMAANSEIYKVYVGVNKTYEIDAQARGYIGQVKSFNTMFDKIVHLDTLIIRMVMYLEKDKIVQPIALNGQLFDENTREPIEGTVDIYEGTELVAHLSTTKSLFNASVKTNTEYQLVAKSNKYFEKKEVFTWTFQDTKKDIYLAKDDNAGKLTIKDIYYDTDKYSLKPASLIELEKLLAYMIQYPDAKIEVSGHTDIVGSHASNMILSNNRAKSIGTWLTTRGISKDRISYKWFGPDKPIGDNKTVDGRALNRRSEIRILE